jgi:AAA domain
MGLLDKAENSKKTKPHFIGIGADPGWGKSTMAAEAPDCLFIDLDGGLSNLDVMALNPTSFKEILSIVDELLNSKHKYKSLAIDTIDKAEKMLGREIAKKYEKENIVDIGYGKGYDYLAEEFKALLDKLSLLREKMNVILLSHTAIKNVKNPAGDDWIRTQPNMSHDKTLMPMIQAVDCWFYGTYELFTKKDGLKTKAFGDGVRILHTENRPGHIAKNRFALPPVMSSGWEEFVKACEKGDDEPAIDEAIKRKLETIKDDSLTEKVLAHSKGADLVKKKKILEKLIIREEALSHV